MDSKISHASVAHTPGFSGDGYGWGGGAVLIVGDRAIPLGEDQNATAFARSVAHAINTYLDATAQRDSLMDAVQELLVCIGFQNDGQITDNQRLRAQAIENAEAVLSKARGEDQ